MAEIFFYKYFLLIIILLFQIEFFFFLCYDYTTIFLKTLRTKKQASSSNLLKFKTYNTILFLFFFLSILSLKGSMFTNNFLIILFTLIFFILSQSISSLSTYARNLQTNIQIVLSLFFMYFIFFNLIQSFLIFFFFIEVYGVLYYFIFLTNYSFTNQTLLKYKNSLLLLLWNNFLTTILLSIACFFLFKTYGTTSFTDLIIIAGSSSISYLFFIGVAWKLGLPLFHFFKLELYKYLLKENVFYFPYWQF